MGLRRPAKHFILYLLGLFITIGIVIIVGIDGSYKSDFGGWKIAKANGPFWVLAQIFFLAAGLMLDVAFIRLAVVLGNIFITAWVIYGVATWPDVWFSPIAAIHVDQLVWCLLCILANALPMFRQFRFDDSRISFEIEDHEEEAEAVWREWWRRSGIPRFDFKMIAEIGEWLEIEPGMVLSTKEKCYDSSDSDGEDKQLDGKTESDVFYYIVSGALNCQPDPNSGLKSFQIKSGQFLDAFVLMAALGQTSVCLAMQTGPTTAVGAEKGTLVIKWNQKAMDQIRFSFSTFAPACLKTIVSSATLDSLYRHEVTPEKSFVYENVERRRLELVRAPLPKDAACVERKMWEQFWLNLVSIRDLWDPSPHQRVVNAVMTGSRELSFYKHLEQAKEEVAEMQITAVKSGYAA